MDNSSIDKNEYHFKYGQCEQCGIHLDTTSTLQAVHFWLKKTNDRYIPYYLYVCDTCFENKQSWCTTLYPDHCQRCDAIIEDEEYHLDRSKNRQNEPISSHGITSIDECKIICENCAKSE